MKWITFSGLDRYRDLGMAVVRIGLGLMMMMHGWPKVAAGAAKWQQLGSKMSVIGVDFFPTFFGAAAAFTEFFGGALVLIGLATRPAAMLMVFVLFIASMDKLAGGGSIMSAAHPIETGLAFLALVFAGPGNFSIDGRLKQSGG